MEKKNRVLIGCIVLVVILLLVILFKTGLFSGREKAINEIKAGNAFFISNEKSGEKQRYKLYSSDGRLLSEESFTSASDMEYGFALVQNEKGDLGIIKENGKMAVEFGKYKYIVGPHNGFYNILDEKKVVNGDGKVIYDYGKELGETASVNLTEIEKNLPYATIETKDFIKVYYYDGTLIKEFSGGDNKEKLSTLYGGVSKLENNYRNNGKYTSFSFDNSIVIIKDNTGKIVFEEKLDSDYRLDAISEDEKLIILKGLDDDSKTTVVRNKSIVNVDSGYSDFQLSSNGRYILGVKGDDSYYYDGEKFNKIEDGMAILDEYHFAKYDEAEKKITFFDNGNEVGTLAEEIKSISANGDFYEVENHEGKYYLVDRSGKKCFDKEFVTLGDFDKNGVAICSEENGSEYLINTSGKVVSNSYGSITAYMNSDYYKVIVNGYCGIINNEGRELIAPDKYTYLSVEYAYNSGLKLKTENTDGTYDVYTESGLVMEKAKGYIRFEDLYLRVEDQENKKYDYYTYKGKQICSIELGE